MSFKITLGETSAKFHPEADLHIDNHLGLYDKGFLIGKGEILHDPNDIALGHRLDAISASDVEVITTLQGRYSLSMIGKIVNRLRDRGVSVTITIETLPEDIRHYARSPKIQYHGTLSTFEQPLRIFLCHCSADKEKVRDLYQYLVMQRVDVYFDEKSLIPGQDWNQEIQTAIHNSDLVLVCLSKQAINKAGYVQKEIRMALDVADEQPEGATYIIPVKFEECEVPSRLQKWQWVNLFDPEGNNRLYQALRMRATYLREQRSKTGA